MTPCQKAGFSVVGLPAERTQIHIIFHSVHEFSSLQFCPQIVRGCFWCWGREGGGRQETEHVTLRYCHMALEALCVPVPAFISRLTSLHPRIRLPLTLDSRALEFLPRQSLSFSLKFVLVKGQSLCLPRFVGRPAGENRCETPSRHYVARGRH